MDIKIKKSVDLTPALQSFIENKLMPLAKFVKPFDETGEAAIWLEISRTTKHHRKGDVYFAAADLRLPKKIIRAQAYAGDVRKAIDGVKDTLRVEIKKYRTHFENKPRAIMRNFRDEK
ncbi:MAG: ribosome-associated translation inhibitor RaiA [Patescibacteria group bacterium]|nr:ribosome-associated translation inhibitor RaiA [Patescibacteria group bacterium]